MKQEAIVTIDSLKLRVRLPEYCVSDSDVSWNEEDIDCFNPLVNCSGVKIDISTIAVIHPVEAVQAWDDGRRQDAEFGIGNGLLIRVTLPGGWYDPYKPPRNIQIEEFQPEL